MIPRTFIRSSYVVKLPITTWGVGGNLDAITKWEKTMDGGEFFQEDNKFNS